MNFKGYKDKTMDDVKERARGVRFRALLLAAMFAMSLIFYLFLNVALNERINVIDIAIMFVIQWVVSTVWFPEGVEFGKRDKAFVKNREAYNAKANRIITLQKTGQLREFCKVDFEERKRLYIEKMLSIADVTLSEYEILKTKPIEEFQKKGLFIDLGNGREILLNAKQKRILKKLIFKDLGIEKNNPDTIMSGVEIKEQCAIRNAESVYKKRVFVIRLVQSTIGAIILAYIGYQLREGLDFAVFVRAFIYFTTFIATIVVSFVQGEESIKTHKNTFLMQLTNFIDRFFEYAEVAALTPVRTEEVKDDSNNVDSSTNNDIVAAERDGTNKEAGG